jgi:hypothetical protein
VVCGRYKFILFKYNIFTNHTSQMNIEPATNYSTTTATALVTQESSSGTFLTRVVLVILLLALIGFNVFTYLDDFTEWFGETFGKPFREVARILGNTAADTAKKTIDISASGAKGIVDVTSGAATSGIDVLQKTIEKKQIEDPPIQIDNVVSNLKKDIPLPDDSMSRTQRGVRSKGSGAGYCYIGQDRGFRSCINIGENDVCMSGNIYPTESLCINPRLRV